jgi:hypothetical protein
MEHSSSLLHSRDNHKEMKIYILFQGWRNNCANHPIAAFRSKKSVRDYVRKNYPDYQGVQRMEPNQMYWQSEYEWLRCEDETIKVIE